MSDLLGIIAPLKKFLSNTDESVSIPFGNPDQKILSLSANRIYYIPDFQREIRWENENISQLIDDIRSGPKYLGNVILTQHSIDNFSIIDGQQRMTVLTMILICICKKHGEKIDVFSPCTLSIQSFSEFSNLLFECFPPDKLEDSTVAASDKLHQRNKYYNLWNYICEYPIVKNQIEAERLVENLGKSTVNIILNRSSDISDGIGYFIDVNLKGKQLDTEDIFKSYLFKNDPRPEIREEWYRLKENVTKANQNKISYPLIKFIEHYFYCDLYKDLKYKGLEFGEDFLLKKEFRTREAEPHIFREGVHIIELVRNKTYMLHSLCNLNNAIEVMIEIVTSDSTTQKFESYFCCLESKKKVRMDSNELKIIHNIMGKVLKDSKSLPKALIMKYILSTLLDKESKAKDDLRKIYGVYLLAVLFTVFENKKSKDVLLSVLKADNTSWYSELVNQIKSYFSLDKITDARLLAQYKLATNEDEEDYRFRCKSLATIYNFFRIDGEKVTIRKVDQLHKFITDDSCFSIEHFIISNNNSEKTIIVFNEMKLEYQYNKAFYGKFVNSLFNFIFIPKELNSRLKNLWLPCKLDMINASEIECDYSRMYLEKVQKLGDSIKKSFRDDSLCKDDLDLYFARDFKEQYVEFSRIMLKEIIEKIKS